MYYDLEYLRVHSIIKGRLGVLNRFPYFICHVKLVLSILSEFTNNLLPYLNIFEYCKLSLYQIFNIK